MSEGAGNKRSSAAKRSSGRAGAAPRRTAAKPSAAAKPAKSVKAPAKGPKSANPKIGSAAAKGAAISRNAKADPVKATLPKARPQKAGSPMVECEIFHYVLYDVGRGLDLKKVKALIPANPDIGLEKRRDTPASIALPKSLVVQLGAMDCRNPDRFECLTATGKIYEDGAVSIIVRVKTRRELERLHEVTTDKLELIDGEATLAEFAQSRFDSLWSTIAPAARRHDYDRTGKPDSEDYTAFCIVSGEGTENPEAFLEGHRAYLAALLISETGERDLHQSQIASTLATPFSYHDHDLAIFDLDRCLVIDPSRDYEDLLIIVEHANYQLLELRALDTQLDTWLDEAERDVRSAYSPKGRRIARLGRSLSVKFASIQALRVDALFILENLENSSKIIGDYFLGKIYAHLCDTFNTAGWKWSVERRLDTLQNIYEVVRGDVNERTMLVLEVVFISVSVFQVFQMFLMG
jgi:hypothetical protein